MNRTRVLIVNPTPIIRAALTASLHQHPDLEVVGAVADAYAARDAIEAEDPDALCLAVSMPRMGGLEFLRRLMPQHPMPVVLLSGLTGPEAAEARREGQNLGAACVLPQPSLTSERAWEKMVRLLGRTLVQAHADWQAPAPLVHRGPARSAAPKPAGATSRIFALGASTGGVEALEAVLTQLPADAPPTVVVQHMPPRFTTTLAHRLDSLCAMDVAEAGDGDVLRQGQVLLAPGGWHLEVRGRPDALHVALHQQDKVHGHRPSVSVMMHSLARVAGKRTAAAVLTGMGGDGSDGLLAIREAGGFTVTQDRGTSVVYGMPRVAWELGAACAEAPLQQVAARLLRGHTHDRRGAA